MSSDSEPDTLDYHHDWKFREIENGLKRNDDTLLNEALKTDSETVLCITSPDNETLLHLVTKFNRLEAAKQIVLLGIGTNINARNTDGETPLFKATKCKDAEMFKFLLNNGADINIVPQKGPNFLQASLFWGSIETVQLILKILYKEYVDQEENKAEDIQNCQKIVKFLLDQQIDVIFPNTNFSSLLCFVMKFGDEETFKLILQKDKNFDVNAVNPTGKPLLHFAILNKKFSFVDLLIDYGADIRINSRDNLNILHSVVRVNNPELLRFFLKHEIDVNGKTKNNQYTPLHFAVALGNKEIVEILLTAGADIKAKFSKESAVLNIVCGCTKLKKKICGEINDGDVGPKMFFDIDMIKFLLERGADTDVFDDGPDRENISLLGRACQAGRMDIVELLGNYGADFFSTKHEKNMIHHAVIGGNVDIIDLLMRKGLNVNANDSGYSPLCYALKNDELDGVRLIEFLVDNGGDVNNYPKHFFGEYQHPLRLAIERNLSYVIECLMELKTDLIRFENVNINSASDFTLSFKILIPFIALTKVDIYDKKTPSWHEDFIYEFFEGCKIQILQMKKTRLYENNSVSFHDFLISDLMKVTNFTNIAKTVEILESSDYQSEFPDYAFLLEKRIERVKTILDFKNSIAEFLKKYAKLELPVDVLDHIFSFLRVGHVRNFARALILSKKESYSQISFLPVSVAFVPSDPYDSFDPWYYELL